MTALETTRVLLVPLMCVVVLGGCAPDQEGVEPVSTPSIPALPPPQIVGTPGSSFDDLLVVNPSRTTRATAADIAIAESALGVRLPRGYAKFVRRVGGGSLGHFIGVYSPDALPKTTQEWRTRVQDYWFWDTVEAGANRDSLQQRGVVLASSFDGDELCFDPADPETLFVLPRNEDVAYRVGPGFLDALQWMLSGNLNPWVEGWTFEANAHRVEQRPEFPDGPSLAEATRALTALGMHSHLVELDGRTTFFFPEISGRLSAHGEEDSAALWVDFYYDDEADPTTVARILAAIKDA